MTYAVWITLTLIYNLLVCYFGMRFSGTNFRMTYMSMVLAGFIPTWALASYWSTNLIFDGLLYDSILTLSSPLFFWLLGAGKAFSALNWFGVLVTLLGLVLVRV